MRYKQIKLGVVLFLGIGLTELEAQEAVTSSGADAIGSGGSVNYSVGQLLYSSNSSISGSELQGIQQAYEIFTVGIKDEPSNIELTIYPNPTSENITLDIQNFIDEKLNFQLFDIQGRILIDKKITSNKTEIETSNLPTSIYFIKVLQENKNIILFKINKN